MPDANMTSQDGEFQVFLLVLIQDLEVDPQSSPDLLVQRAYIVTPVTKPKGIICFISSKLHILPQIAEVLFQHFTELLSDIFIV